jgi:hypothetical protein
VKTCARCGTQRSELLYNCIVCHAELCGECSEDACAVDQAEVDEINQRSRQTDGEGRRLIAEELSARRKRLQVSAVALERVAQLIAAPAAPGGRARAAAARFKAGSRSE